MGCRVVEDELKPLSSTRALSLQKLRLRRKAVQQRLCRSSSGSCKAGCVASLFADSLPLSCSSVVVEGPRRTKVADRVLRVGFCSKSVSDDGLVISSQLQQVAHALVSRFKTVCDVVVPSALSRRAVREGQSSVIVSQVKDAMSRGAEVALTGINLGSYKAQLEGMRARPQAPQTFSGSMLAKNREVGRLRLSSLEPLMRISRLVEVVLLNGKLHHASAFNPV